MDVVASKADLSKEPKFAEAVAHKVYYGPVYFRRESEPYMTLALAGTRRDAGVSVAEVNLKLIGDVVSQSCCQGRERPFQGLAGQCVDGRGAHFRGLICEAFDEIGHNGRITLGEPAKRKGGKFTYSRGLMA